MQRYRAHTSGRNSLGRFCKRTPHSVWEFQPTQTITRTAAHSNRVGAWLAMPKLSRSEPWSRRLSDLSLIVEEGSDIASGREFQPTQTVLKMKGNRRPAESKSIMIPTAANYWTLTTLPALMQRVQTRSVVTLPSWRARTLRRFGLKRRLVRLWAWETLCPNWGPLPQISQALDNFDTSEKFRLS